jgi:ABC-type lipoprotein export system ATPase subunit
MAPTTVRAVLLAGGHADGVIVGQNNFEIIENGDAPSITALEQVVAAILGIRQDAVAGGYQVTSTGVTWAGPASIAGALRHRLAVGKVENVLLVPALPAAASAVQALSHPTRHPHTALLYIEPDAATFAVINTDDGSVAAMRKRSLPEDDDEAVAALADMIKRADEMDPRPEKVFVIGPGVDIPLIKPALEAVTSLPVTTPEDPELALARGAALVSVNAPLLAPPAAVLAQTVGAAANYTRAAVLHIASDTATTAVISTVDGSVSEVHRRFLPDDDDEAVSALVEMIKGADAMGSGPDGPDGIVIVGRGVGVQMIKPALEAATSLPVSALEMPLPKTEAPAPMDAPLPAPAGTSYPHERGAADGNPHLPGERYGVPVLEARNLCKSFGRGVTVTPVLKNINLRIFPGEFVALIGPSGSGKSTLLSILGLLEPPSSGDVLINQKSVAQLSPQELAGVRGHRIGYVFQSFNLLAGLSVAENVMLPSMLSGESGRAQYDRAITLLDQFGLAGLAKRVPAELSGGEQQRVAIARALFMTPDVILADEPTGNLDTTNGRKVIDALYRLNSAGQTIVLVTHDRSIASETPRLVSLLDGRIETDTSPIQASGNTTWRTSR